MMKKIICTSIILFILLTIKTLGSQLFVSENIQPDSLNKYQLTSRLSSDKEMGVSRSGGVTAFRLFAPNAEKVSLVLFNTPEENPGTTYEMKRDDDGVWQTELNGIFTGKFYNYSVKHKDKEPVLCLDPYAKAVATFNTYWSPRKGIIVDERYDWGNDEWIEHDWRDLIIYEMHVKDMTADPTSGAKNPGTYKALTEKGIKGGIDYIKNLGVNAVELLPSQEFANIEIPYNDSSRGRFNTWNPYERNHWGYMTAAFFAPEEYYVDNKLEWNKWVGTDGRQVSEFKNMVKAFHKEGIAVIMDVVYNHLSEYEFGNLKEIDKNYYFRLDEKGNYLAESYCGNDLKTEAPMTRRLIVESLLYWMKEYHIDGFRFDLGLLIDWETVEEIIYQVRKINPNVVIVCEPWGGGYDPAGFSLRGWGSWNDQIRNGIKGENPLNGQGWIFGKWYGNNSRDRVKSYVNGTLVRDSLGLFQKKEHSVNYLESHDGYTLGDFIRIGTGEVKENQVIKYPDSLVKLSPLQMKLNKLGAMFLMTSQGITMIQSGQEFARTKVIPLNINVEDELKGHIDHNTYNKDNETNFINYNHADANKSLVDYYKGLISIRSKYPEFRHAAYDDIIFLEPADNQYALGYMLTSKENTFIVLFNASPDKEETFILPGGKWRVIADDQKTGLNEIKTIKKKITLKSSTGCILKKK